MLGVILAIVIGLPLIYLFLVVRKWWDSHCIRCGSSFWNWNLFDSRKQCFGCRKRISFEDAQAEEYFKSKKDKDKLEDKYSKEDKKQEEKFTCSKCEIVYKEEYLGGEMKDGKVCKYCLEEMKKEKAKK